MNIPIDRAVTTNDLRHYYDHRKFTFGNSSALRTICIVGSCRIVPLLNYLRVYNSMNGDPFELICLNPVEMWKGPGHEVSDGVNEILKDYKFDRSIDFLICEHLQYCGILNTANDDTQNIFTDLKCTPTEILRLPNWHHMHIFDAETAFYDKGYEKLSDADRVKTLRATGIVCKDKFLKYCSKSSFPELEQWVNDNWLTIRLGWTADHVSRGLSWKLFELIAERMNITITPELVNHPICSNDTYASTGTILTQIDYEVNNWKF